jgi:hypothetical protein
MQMVVQTPQILEEYISGFFGEIPNIIAIFLNFVVYSCMLWP